MLMGTCALTVVVIHPRRHFSALLSALLALLFCQTVVVVAQKTTARHRELCDDAMDITNAASPLESSTLGLSDSFTPPCVSGDFSQAPERMFFFDVPPRQVLEIGQVANDFSSIQVPIELT